MIFEELLDAKAIVEIDDVHHARAIVDDTCGRKKELRMFRTAEILAALREYYVKIGAETERHRKRDPE